MLHSKWDKPKYDISIKTQEELYKKEKQVLNFQDWIKKRKICCVARSQAGFKKWIQFLNSKDSNLTTLESFVLLPTGAQDRAQCQKCEYIHLGIGIFSFKCTGKLCISRDYIIGSVSVMFFVSVFHVKAKLIHKCNNK